ncbi:ABC transporter ATP-binding protein/permease [Hymenobacter sp. BT178]|uniref:ABC transporter ATP-binding protein/permease n=2 Tax=Hymenobacter lucidus TaxID=2880930 RepID=A0ABS8ASW5_9BACT|nr:ABC transporter ATP-binding protein/permease [Hymenobacter lucidus]
MRYLSPAEKKRAIMMFLLQLFTSFLDVFGLASLIPVVTLASHPGSVMDQKWSAYLYKSTGFQTEAGFFIFVVVVIFIFFLIKNIFISWINYKQVKFTAEIALKIIDSQYIKYIGLPFWKFQEIGTFEVVNEVLTVPNSYLNGIVRQVFVLLSEIVIVLIVVLGILVYQPTLFVILAFTLVPATVITYKLLRNRSQELGNQRDLQAPKAYGIVSDTFAGYVELKLANKLQLFRQRINENQALMQGLDAKAYVYGLLPVRIIEMVSILAVSTIIIYSLLFSGDSTNLITIVGLFAAAAYKLMPSVNRILASMVMMKQHFYTLEALDAYEEPQWQEHLVEQQSAVKFQDKVEFDNISFAFPGSETPVLRGVSFSVKKGEKIGFIGSSGSGKTTLMNLLLRFYTQQNGEIRVDGVPLRLDNTEAWHRLVGYVKQDTFLMQASLRDNITLGETNPDPQRLQYALEQASLAEFVASLPQGLDTVSGERGARLSGGQRQRIGIARAMYKQTQILVMDEATSALDTQTEKEVSEAINKLSATDITILIIAHRITTLRQCDRIYELKDGKIIAVHTYDELIERHV